jgi:tRNA pseudouridine13 synthase
MNNYLTTSFAGTGGSLKESPEDFLVEELPLYTPCGDGEHLYLTVEKRDLTTFDLLQQLARALGVPEREIGYAGLKDARATTRQTVSIAGVRPEQAMALELAGVRILAARYHETSCAWGIWPATVSKSACEKCAKGRWRPPSTCCTCWRRSASPTSSASSATARSAIRT